MCRLDPESRTPDHSRYARRWMGGNRAGLGRLRFSQFAVAVVALVYMRVGFMCRPAW